MATPPAAQDTFDPDLYDQALQHRPARRRRQLGEQSTANARRSPRSDPVTGIGVYRSLRLPSASIISGRGGVLRTNGGNYEGMIWRRRGQAPALEPYAATCDDTILNAITHVVAACEQRTPFEMDAEDGYRAIELCAAWKASAATHQPVALPLGKHHTVGVPHRGPRPQGRDVSFLPAV